MGKIRTTFNQLFPPDDTREKHLYFEEAYQDITPTDTTAEAEENSEWAEWADGSPQSLARGVAAVMQEQIPEQLGERALHELGFAGLTEAGIELQPEAKLSSNGEEA